MRILLFFLVLLSSGFSSGLHGQAIAVVDVKMAYDNYFKTQEEVKVINTKGQEFINNIDARKADYQSIVSKMVDLDKIVRSTEFSQERRLAARTELEKLAEDRFAKSAEIEAAERKANSELYSMRAQMESRLLGDIRTASEDVAKAKGYDLVLDKSFLPSANKMIVYVAPKVPEITAEVIARVNASAPATN